MSTAFESANETFPGPLTLLHTVVTAPGGFGSPSSPTVPSSAAVAGSVMDRFGPASTVGATFVGGGAPSSMWRSGALPGSPSYARAVRCPVPVMMIASAFPLAQPGRFTISWITLERFGVRWFGPASPTSVHGTGDQFTAAVVRGREETLRLELVKVPGLSAACPFRTRFVASLCVSSASNWIHAFAIVAPGGTVTFVNRRPTVCRLVSNTSSRSALARFGNPLDPSSASSLLAAMRRSIGGAGGATVTCIESLAASAPSSAVSRSR